MILPFSIPSPDVQYIDFGTYQIFGFTFSPVVHFYALCIIVGIIFAGIWTARRLGQRGGERGAVFDFIVWSLVMGIVGARLYHVVTHWGDFFGPDKNPLDVFAFWKGGIAIFGALLGGAIGVLIASRLTGIRFLSFADALVPGLLLAQAIGRLGNWFNHELFGGPTTLPWGLEIESSNPAFPIGLPEGTLFHPTFLYEAVWNILGIIVLLAIERKWRPRWGKFFAMYLIWYGIGRTFTESLRVDPSLLFLGQRTNVLAAALAAVLGIVILIVQHRRHPGLEPSPYLPGRQNPADAVLKYTSNPDEYYHVIDRGERPTDASNDEDLEHASEEEAAADTALASPTNS
ncbi:prolipoprotein diacylglyceryl transferase [Leucobacter coleopterorum]|uniref:Phosphatidylglycerol--prolipoprotein diacylglyceryl transferase n=1 Tax=Leucobacter coleopterorum TaxID=2714933 RepID=A0ABX6JZV9_9MICO|nr:prolipoprotein diacylglyceryl transferase [Leucobacter coleopterorum]QIM18359.1 prolipoprotein diacylglyceryl transferase [Leucobacter coleopterorum]